ncbi:MAG: Hsp20/alpha crystallin family protein [Flavitalea sp.]
MTHVKFSTRPNAKSLDNLFDELLNVNWNSPLGGNNAKPSNEVPAVNIFETKDAYHLELNVAGRNKEDFKVNLEDGLLTISYEKQEAKEDADYKTVRREFNFKNFSRSFHVDDKINAENIEAKYENGLLKLLLPKREEPKNQVKQISIQ